MLAKGSHQNCAGKLAKSAQLALGDEEFNNMIPIYGAAAISNNHEDEIDDPSLIMQQLSLCLRRSGIQ